MAALAHPQSIRIFRIRHQGSPVVFKLHLCNMLPTRAPVPVVTPPHSPRSTPETG
jgi:hypothetical protein